MSIMQLRHGKTPKQDRARARVERVLAGAAVVFAEWGYAKTTTNRIAAEAEVHVPSVYQYFANKDALLAELWDRHVDTVISTLEQMIAAYEAAPVADAVRMYVGAILRQHAEDPALLAVLYDEAPRLEGVRSLREEATELLVPYLERHESELRPTDFRTVAFVLAASVEGVARQAVRPPAPPMDQLLDEVTTLVCSYLGVER